MAGWSPLGGEAPRWLKVHDALGRAGWYAVLSEWHTELLAKVVTSEVDEPLLPMSKWGDAEPVGHAAADAADRYEAWCDRHDLDPTRPSHGVVALERLGILVRRRFLLLFRRFALADPVPDAATHPDLDDETRAAAERAAVQFVVTEHIDALLDEADGRIEVGSLAELAAGFGTDPETLEALADDGGYGWDLVVGDDGRAALVLVEDEG